MEQEEIVRRLGAVETGAVTDSLNRLRLDGWMTGLHPVNKAHRIAGRAFTIQYSHVKDDAQRTYNYYNVLDEIKPGDVLVVAANGCTNAIMGENMQHAALKKGSGGIVLDGSIRDAGVIGRVELPVFKRGNAIRFMPDNFKIVGINVPVTCGDILVNPGDYIVGDVDGVIAISPEYVERILDVAEKIMVIEDQMDKALEMGKSMKECLDVIGQKKKIEVTL